MVVCKILHGDDPLIDTFLALYYGYGQVTIAISPAGMFYPPKLPS